MKRTLITMIAVLAMAASIVGCEKKRTTVTVGDGTVFDISAELLATHTDTLVNIGRIREGEIVQYDGWLRNAGTEPLVIKDITTSCGCTSVEYEKKPVAPGEKGRFSFRFDSRGFSGTQLKLIEISTSAATKSYKVMVQAEVSTDEAGTDANY